MKKIIMLILFVMLAFSFIMCTPGDETTGYKLTITAENGEVTVTDADGNEVSDLTAIADGTKLTLEATPADGYEFDSWSGDLTGTDNPATLTMDADKSVTANFVTLKYRIIKDTTYTNDGSDSFDENSYTEYEYNSDGYKSKESYYTDLD
ncbi:MAG: InlB B-repeat-containing protein, partial [Spirochaetota bacterium]